MTGISGCFLSGLYSKTKHQIIQSEQGLMEGGGGVLT